jgi:hypothetical protein
MTEKMHEDREIKQMTERLSEDFVLQLVMVIVIFIPLGFAGRLLSNYIIGGNLFLSSLTAIVGTLLSVVIFLTLNLYFRLSLTLAIGLLSNIALLLSLYLLLWRSGTLTLKYAGTYLFRDGYVTIAGVAHYFPLALWDSIISCLDFVIYSKLYEIVAGSRRR